MALGAFTLAHLTPTEKGSYAVPSTAHAGHGDRETNTILLRRGEGMRIPLLVLGAAEGCDRGRFLAARVAWLAACGQSATSIIHRRVS
jgi:hypothetical protein